MADQPNNQGRRWDDAQDKRIDDLMQQQRVIAPLATQVAVLEAKLETAGDHISSVRDQVLTTEDRLARRIDACSQRIEHVDETCARFREEQGVEALRSREARAGRKMAIALAVIAGLFTVIASMVTAISQVFGS